MLSVKDLSFEYPEELVAQTPSRPSRVMWVEEAPEEISIQDLLHRIPAGDVLVINNTKVLKRRIFIDDLEILFLSSKDQTHWQVLFPASRRKIGEVIELPLGRSMKLLEKGRPQLVQASEPLTEKYFEEVAQIPLPPYIQKARNERQTRSEDESWYQTAWAQAPGSLAAPTASLHFQAQDLEILKIKGVQICEVTLHVGLGTFLPVTTEYLKDHQMHTEEVEITAASWRRILEAKRAQHKIWCLGTTAARSVESAALGLLKKQKDGAWRGESDLMIAPPYDWQIVDRLLTNFHQPESTLLALVAAISDLRKVKSCYAWAIERRFRLFSYGDLSVWLRAES